MENIWCGIVSAVKKTMTDNKKRKEEMECNGHYWEYAFGSRDYPTFQDWKWCVKCREKKNITSAGTGEENL